MDDRINLLMSVDEKFYKPFLVAFYSIRTNTHHPLRLFFAGTLNNVQKEDIKRIDPDVELVIIDESAKDFDILRRAKSNTIYPLCSLYRIICPFMVKGIEKLLWIDSDVVVDKDINQIFSYNLNGTAIGAIADTTKRVQNLKVLKGHKINKYFFSGLILFNIQKIQNRYSLSQFKEAIDDIAGDTSFPDQDILNIVYADDVTYIPDKYNQLLVWNQRKDIKIRGKKYIIYHFAGDVKPWQKEFYNFKNDYIYWKYGKHIYSKYYRFLHFFNTRLFFLKKTILRILGKA